MLSTLCFSRCLSIVDDDEGEDYLSQADMMMSVPKSDPLDDFLVEITQLSDTQNTTTDASSEREIVPETEAVESSVSKTEDTFTGSQEEQEPIVWQDWCQYIDKASNTAYYLNTATNVTTWTRPEGFPVSTARRKDGESEREEGEGPQDWVSAVDPTTGKTYWWNRVTSETTWKKPATHEKEELSLSSDKKSSLSPSTVPRANAEQRQAETTTQHSPASPVSPSTSRPPSVSSAVLASEENTTAASSIDNIVVDALFAGLSARLASLKSVFHVRDLTPFERFMVQFELRSADWKNCDPAERPNAGWLKSHLQNMALELKSLSAHVPTSSTPTALPPSLRPPKAPSSATSTQISASDSPAPPTVTPAVPPSSTAHIHPSRMQRIKRPGVPDTFMARKRRKKSDTSTLPKRLATMVDRWEAIQEDNDREEEQKLQEEARHYGWIPEEVSTGHAAPEPAVLAEHSASRPLVPKRKTTSWRDKVRAIAQDMRD